MFEMAAINDQDLLDEIRFDIKVKDLRKAELVLAALGYVKRETQKKALLEVSRADEAFAIPLLTGFFVNSPDIAESFPLLKETMYAKMFGRPEVLQGLLLNEPNPAVRAFQVEVAGEIKLAAAVPALMDILANETDPAIVRSAIASLGLIGDGDAVPLIGGFVKHADKDLTVAAVRALGEMATPEAIHTLAGQLGNDPELDHLIIDILSKVQTPEAIVKLNETLTSEHAHIRTAGKQKLGAIGTMSVRVLIKNLNRGDPDLVIHSLNVLGDIGDAAAVSAIRKLLHNEPDNANIRFAAYETLGRLPVGKGAFALAAGLEDPVDNVRAAAAKAIDRNYNALLAGGIRNMLRSGNGTADRIMDVLINSQCDRIFLDLVEEDFFKTDAIEFLNKKAHPDVRAYYARILSAKGLQELARLIAVDKEPKGRTTLRVYAVDDSKMILNIYRTVLHNLGCESIPFELPVIAVERVKEDRPDVILTDLNMPGLTGLDLTARIRQWFPKEKLPIIMVTTQDESRDLKNALAAGVNGVIQKPFTESQISTALKKFAGLQVKEN
jgi:CheY-like chemotaxis protein